MFPKGNSPLGLSDTCGNIWEWQSNYFDMGNTAMALKGGSYKTLDSNAKVSNRAWQFPERREAEIGFRVIIEI